MDAGGVGSNREVNFDGVADNVEMEQGLNEGGDRYSHIKIEYPGQFHEILNELRGSVDQIGPSEVRGLLRGRENEKFGSSVKGSLLREASRDTKAVESGGQKRSISAEAISSKMDKLKSIAAESIEADGKSGSTAAVTAKKVGLWGLIAVVAAVVTIATAAILVPALVLASAPVWALGVAAVAGVAGGIAFQVGILQWDRASQYQNPITDAFNSSDSFENFIAKIREKSSADKVDRNLEIFKSYGGDNELVQIWTKYEDLQVGLGSQNDDRRKAAFEKKNDIMNEIEHRYANFRMGIKKANEEGKEPSIFSGAKLLSFWVSQDKARDAVEP